MSAAEYRMLQVFLSREDGEICEVSFRQKQPPHFLCTCSDEAQDCKHSRIVEARLKRLNGHYPFPRVDSEKLADAVTKDAATFRLFVLEHGVVELI